MTRMDKLEIVGVSILMLGLAVVGIFIEISSTLILKITHLVRGIRRDPVPPIAVIHRDRSEA